MSLLEPFSKPRWQHSKPEVRLAAVDELDDPAVLLEVLQTDEDPGVRARALSRIDCMETLDRLIDEPDLADVVLVGRRRGEHGQGTRCRDGEADPLGVRRRVDDEDGEATSRTTVAHEVKKSFSNDAAMLLG